MNALSYFFFAAFLLFAGQAHSSNILLEHFSERFAQTRIPTPEDFVVGRSMKFSCTEFIRDKKRSEYTLLFTLSEVEVVYSSDLKSEYFVFNDLGLTGVWENDNASYRHTWKIASDGKWWIGEWAGKLKKGALKDARGDWWKNTIPSVIDPDYRVRSYSICKRVIVKTEE